MKQLYVYFWKKYRIEILKNMGLLLSISIVSTIGPLLLRQAINYNLETGFQLDKILLYLGMLTFLFLTKFFYNRFKFQFEETFKNKETEELYRKICAMSYEKINKLEPTYLAERVTETINTIFGLYSSSLSGIFVSAVTMFFILCIILTIHPVLAFLYFLQIPLQYIGFQKLLNGENAKLSQYGIQLQETRAKNQKNIKAVMSDVNSLKQYGANSGILSFIRKNVQEINQVARKGNQYAMDICTLLEYICQIIKNISYLFIIYLYVNGNATIGDIVYLNLMNDIYFGSIGDVIQIQVNLKDLKAAMKFIIEEVEKNQELDGSIELKRVDTISGELSHIGYETIELIQKGSFSFQRGDRIALKGDSGVGKSTFAKLLNKFIEADGICINGIPIQQISNASLRSKILYLPQNSYLLPFSIKENLLLGQEYESERWEKLMKMEFMKKFLDMEDSLETIIYENGTNLSGGDRQKIILGRIFLQNPDVILLDESFHAIDEETGMELMEAICSMYSDKIILLISHSAKYFRTCNKIVEIKNKRLIQKDRE